MLELPCPGVFCRGLHCRQLAAPEVEESERDNDEELVGEEGCDVVGNLVDGVDVGARADHLDS